MEAEWEAKMVTETSVHSEAFGRQKQRHMEAELGVKTDAKT